MTYFYREIGGRIQRQRKQKGYTCAELAGAIHVEENRLVEFEAGRRRIYVDQLSNLAILLEVSTDYLIYGKADAGN